MTPLLALATALFVAHQEPAPTPLFDDAELARSVARVLAPTVALRRDIHAQPELGEREHSTAARVAAHLRGLSLEVREGIAVTGVLGVLRGGRPGAVVAYRADMDALPVTERTGLAFASTREDDWDGARTGVMHACGHDVHTAIALGLASILAEPAVRARLPGTVLFLFQPAEEGHPDPGLHGAERMLAEGVFEPDPPGAVLGLHVDPALAVGEVALLAGGALAAVDRFEVEVVGRQTHGAYPQNGVDPIVAASHVVCALQTIASRTVDTRDVVVVSVGKLEAGNRFNIIPERARLLGTIRTHDAAVQERVHAALERIARDVAHAFGAEALVTIERICPVTRNDPALVEALRPSVAGLAKLVDVRPQMGGEDFAHFARAVPGLYYFLGVSDPDKGEAAMIHTPYFSPDERALEVGLRVSTRLVTRWLETHAAR